MVNRLNECSTGACPLMTWPRITSATTNDAPTAAIPIGAPCQHSVDARREQDRREDQRDGKANGVGGDHGRSSRRAITTAPTRAASRSTDTTSNGSTKFAKTDAPTSLVVDG